MSQRSMVPLCGLNLFHTGGWVGRQADRQRAGGRAGGQTDRQTGRKNTYKNIQSDRQMKTEQADGQIATQTDRRTNRWIGVSVERVALKRINEWFHEKLKKKINVEINQFLQQLTADIKTNHLIPQISKEYRLLKFCYVPDTSATSSKGIFGFFAVATNSTDEMNMAGSTWY